MNDTSPGTSDEYISTVQQNVEETIKLSRAVVVTTPGEIAMIDLRKELNFCIKTRSIVIGIVENMAISLTRLADLTFLRKDRSDCTSELIAEQKEKCPELLDMTDSTETKIQCFLLRFNPFGHQLIEIM